MGQENNNFNEENLNSENSNVENSEFTPEENNMDSQNNINQTLDNQANIEQPVNPKSKSKIWIIILIVLLLGIGCAGYYMMSNRNTPAIQPESKPENNHNISYRMSGNAINDFDLQFLKLENENKNKIYSPLSIKYALEMLSEGANGETKKQITDVLGDYVPKKYLNNANMSFANAMFIRNNYKEFVKNTYIDALTNKFNAEIIYDAFESPDNVNSWISNKTFKLINNLLTDVSTNDFLLVNALAIDMEWVDKIQPEEWYWDIGFIHEDYYKSVSALGGPEGYNALKFKDIIKTVASVEIGAVINKYDLVNTLGEANVRKTVGDAYQKWLDDGAENSCYDPEYSDESEKDPDRETFVNNYIKEVNENYKQLSSSTDFLFYVDDNVKVFAKDLKEYDGTTLEYVGIMPLKENLTTFIKNSNASTINNLVNNLKPFVLDSFKEGVITEMSGYIPMFKFDYELKLIDDLNKTGITDVFDPDKADLSNLSTSKASINKALHKATIEFSNSGIKAAAVTVEGGAGEGECGFDYIFKIPNDRIEKIDLTFDNPYMFLIIDKKSKEVWFTGTVYEPSDFETYTKNIKYDDYDE